MFIDLQGFFVYFLAYTCSCSIFCHLALFILFLLVWKTLVYVQILFTPMEDILRIFKGLDFCKIVLEEGTLAGDLGTFWVSTFYDVL